MSSESEDTSISSLLSNAAQTLALSPNQVIRQDEHDDSDEEVHFSSPDSNENTTTPQDKTSKTTMKRNKSSVILDKMQDQYISRKQKVIGRAKKFLSRFQHTQNPLWAKKMDKNVFVIGVTVTVMTTYFVAAMPWVIPHWYTLLSAFLLSLRFIQYHSEAFHYFMLDFCYFANYLILFYLHFYPTSSFLFVLNFVNTNGPLLFAILGEVGKLGIWKWGFGNGNWKIDLGLEIEFGKSIWV